MNTRTVYQPADEDGAGRWVTVYVLPSPYPPCSSELGGGERRDHEDTSATSRRWDRRACRLAAVITLLVAAWML